MTRRAAVGGTRRAWLAAFASVAVASAATAQSACPPSATTASRAWAAPLDRKIALQARDVSLRDGLDRVAAAAKFRLSYSAELVPLSRHVCVATESVIAGEALLQLLAGSGVEAVVTGPDQVVLTPKQAQLPDEVVTATVQNLDRVVVTGSATGNAQRSLSVALDVLDGDKLRAQSTTTLSQTFDGSVPGLWVWEQSPSSMLARYGSIRGASSFGLSYPKVYIDGIEVANPLLMVQINPSMVDHVEVIRGPQGAALYGADAISGVVNIVTRHEGTQSGADRAEVVTGAGLSRTSYTPKSVFTQNHALTWRGGSSVKSGTLSVNATTLGDYVPSAYSRDLRINGAARAVTTHASFTGTGRFYGKQAAIGENPLVKPTLTGVGATASSGDRHGSLFQTTVDSSRRLSYGDSIPESIGEFTLGGTATIFTSGRWTPSFVLGVDGYRLANVPNDLEPIPSVVDTSLQVTKGGADRGTARASLVGQFGDLVHRSFSLTLAAEHSAIRETTVGRLDSVRLDTTVAWRSNSGLVAQGNLAMERKFFVTGGLRLEENDGFTSSDRTQLLPMIGVAMVSDNEGNTLKLRMAYGKGIRPIQATLREMQSRDGMRGTQTQQLEPEQQSGTEMGIDFLVDRRFGFHLTRFDQTASSLIQPVLIAKDSAPRVGGSGSGPGSSHPPRLTYTFQNVGEISNSGWEIESSIDEGPLNVSGSLTLVDSWVLHIAHGYLGDLRVGDRTLGVPARTAGLTATWRRPHWFVSGGLSRAYDWINYDRLALASDYNGTQYTAQDIVQRLRGYWTRYDGVTRLRASVARDLTAGFSLTLSGDNLTNVQRGEPDNITVLPGRTLLLGLTAKIR